MVFGPVQEFMTCSNGHAEVRWANAAPLFRSCWMCGRTGEPFRALIITAPAQLPDDAGPRPWRGYDQVA